MTRRSAPILLLFLCLSSCDWNKYPSSKYIITHKYRDLISSFKIGDTLKFCDQKGKVSLFAITTIDSAIHDKRGSFINVKEYKDISIACHELTNPRQGYETYNMILITKDPETDSAQFDLRLKDFYGRDTSYPFVKMTDTVKANNVSFTDYYSFRNSNYSEQKDPNSISKIYMTSQDGIIAYKYLDGTWWTKIK